MKAMRISLVIVFAACSLALAAGETKLGEDEAAIRKTIDSYVNAFNRADAEALSAHWTVDGEYVTPTGEAFAGREKLKAAFEKFFKANEGIRLEVTQPLIYVEPGDKAVEEGFAVTVKPGREPESTRYVTSYVKQNGDWKITKIKEILPIGTSPNHDKLEPLSWMVGDWVDQDESGRLATSCNWSTDGNFLVCSFEVSIGELTSFEGKQIIGWDAEAKRIRSWVFDSNGCFGEGIWAKQGESWQVTSTIVLNTGERAVSTNIYTPVDEKSYTWVSTGREVGGVPLPETPKVTVVRRPGDATSNDSDKK
ncbi:MAG: nuclear transport factor 2 family protein [Pseudomonadota bacterium]